MSTASPVLRLAADGLGVVVLGLDLLQLRLHLAVGHRQVVPGTPISPPSSPQRPLTPVTYFFQDSYSSRCAAADCTPDISPSPDCPSSSLPSALPTSSCSPLVSSPACVQTFLSDFRSRPPPPPGSSGTWFSRIPVDPRAAASAFNCSHSSHAMGVVLPVSPSPATPAGRAMLPTARAKNQAEEALAPNLLLVRSSSDELSRIARI